MVKVVNTAVLETASYRFESCYRHYLRASIRNRTEIRWLEATYNKPLYYTRLYARRVGIEPTALGFGDHVATLVHAHVFVPGVGLEPTFRSLQERSNTVIPTRHRRR